ncbi:hypothetical protein Poli38472_003303 [Pythium oligandrum]|uniref:Transmembrane protein n=1 Tax=Pythium oligandrum TaxID=41045 RepID=A0A8K1C6L2_PYTOL|nr:hypothetical protein Poli38472_003303 [Pythium oligandrum]|eukprot:TMW57378.1 hypothetical protein Poli38472_003303 [Pythium oligandrum]
MAYETGDCLTPNARTQLDQAQNDDVLSNSYSFQLEFNAISDEYEDSTLDSIEDESDSIDTILLRAIEPPDHTRLSLADTLSEVKLNDRRKRAFKQLLKRVQMNVWTLHFSPSYERPYCVYLYEHAVARIRYTLAIGFAFILSKALYEHRNVTPNTQRATEWEVVYHLHTFVALPVLALGFFCACLQRLDKWCEIYAALPFVTVTYVLTAQKILLESRGPVFSMFLVLVPVFGIVRFRFLTSVCVVILIFVGHVGGLCCFRQVESPTDVFFQAFNYLGGILVGAVCHYRAEVLRRRNYVMFLPFSDEPMDEDHMHAKLHDPRIKKHVLISRINLKFKNAIVEEAFYRHWYLIDPCPFDHPNAGELHRNVYRTVRFAVGGVILTQLILIVQDWQYLHSDKSFPRAAYFVATMLRFTIVIPAYGLSPVAMLICGLRFYWEWRSQATTEDRGGLRSPRSRSAKQWSSMEESKSRSVRIRHDPTSSYSELTTPKAIKSGSTLLEEASVAPFKNNYVRTLQRMSATVVFFHALAMGVILMLVERLASKNNASVAPCYFLGFLNALLFPHRSGFRVRFVYASIGTGCVCLIILGIACVLENDKVLTYASYMALTTILGMMISHEEESLRRIFFVRMMLRSDEFRRRHDAILKMESWFKQRIRRWRKRRRGSMTLVLQEDREESTQHVVPEMIQIPTVNQMRHAGMVNVAVELSRVALAIITAVT